MKYHSLLPRERAERLNKRLTEGMMAALKTIHSATSPDSMDPADLNRQRRGQEVLGRLASPALRTGNIWNTCHMSGQVRMTQGTSASCSRSGRQALRRHRL